MKVLLAILCLLIMSSCGEPPLKFSYKDEIYLQEYKAKLQRLNTDREAGIAEVERIFSISEKYKSSLNIQLIPIRTNTNKGEGICYRGYIENQGKEIVERLDVNIVLSMGSEAFSHRETVVDYNPYIERLIPQLEPKQQVKGENIPCFHIKNREIKLDSIKYEVVGLSLQPKVKAVSDLDLISLHSKINSLEQKKKKSGEYYQ